MAVRYVILGLACLMAAAGAGASAPTQLRLPLSLGALGTGSEVSYHPSRWLTIRRNVAFVRTDAVRERGSAAAPARRGVRAMTGDIHPFGDGFRLSLGLREDNNRRLLRSSNDPADIGTARYSPLMSIGYAGYVGDGLSIGGDLGMSGRGMAGAGGAVLLTPIEMAQRGRDAAKGFAPLLRLSAGYRF